MTSRGVADHEPAARLAGTPTRASLAPAVEKPRSSLERLHKAVDEPVEFGIRLALALDLADRVDDGGVVLSAEALADLGKRRLGQRLRQVHRDLTRSGDGLGVVLRLELGQLDVV